MSAPQWAAFTDAVLAALRADTAIGASPALVPVLDGPTASADQAATSIIIGGSFDDEDTQAGSFDADWRSDGGASASREETLRLNGAVQTWNGDADIATARTSAFALLSEISRVLRTTPGLGLSALLWCHLTTGEITQELRSGAAVTVKFTITARAVI